MSLLMLSIAMQICTVFVQPMQTHIENKTAGINEIFVSLYLYGIISISSGVDQYGEGMMPDYWARDFCGLWLVATVIGSVAFNIGKFSVEVVMAIHYNCKKKSLKNKYLLLKQQTRTFETIQSSQNTQSRRETDAQPAIAKNSPKRIRKQDMIKVHKQASSVDQEKPQSRKMLNKELKNNFDQFGALIDDILNQEGFESNQAQLVQSQQQISLKPKTKRRFAKARKFLRQKQSIGTFENETKRNDSLHQFGAIREQPHSKMTSITSSANLQNGLKFTGGTYQTYESLRRKYSEHHR
ncbi:hypothetical protein FGO68_gene11618 [Halteria grandinella]|uniref:Potassium channel domain-containing protein n=1 Tax=Halteria grandinella TaxID=5974 RepID=A0A8J8T9M6_HALGN|nr:hypothetical protein FGO68_gene11618 [Halteria grandinella]